ncbi:MAG: hypothetical protein ABH831_00585 [Candidatus Nealsonbacteria bacterium]
MKIRESKNLKYNKFPKRIGPGEGVDQVNPEFCILEKFNRVDDKIRLYFKNGIQAEIKAINIAGGQEIDILEDKIAEYIERSYEDILDINL